MIKKILAVTAAMLLAGCGNMISEQDHITVPKTTVTDKTPTGQEDAPTQTTASAAATTQTTTTPQTTTTAETTTTTTTTTAAATVSTAAPMTPAVVGEDVTPPTILNLEDNIYVQTGSYFDIQEYISYGDNYDPEPQLFITGDVDTSVQGVYPVSLRLTDNAGNTTERSINVNVSDSTWSSEGGELATVPFADFKAQFGGEGRSVGIDISRWQGQVDFEAVKNAGCQFVIIRVGYSTNGGAEQDEWFAANYASAKAAGLKVGVYFYSEDTSEEAVRANARWIIDQIGGDKLDFPIAFDWEDFYHYQNYHMSIHALNEIFEAFADELEQHGYQAMLYSSKNFLELFWENRRDHMVWVAQYNDQVTYSGKFSIWQRCGTGWIDGINGYVDLNVLYDG